MEVLCSNILKKTNECSRDEETQDRVKKYSKGEIFVQIKVSNVTHRIRTIGG